MRNTPGFDNPRSACVPEAFALSTSLFLPFLPFQTPQQHQVLDALIYMSSGKPPRLHMDVKPENILVFNDGAHFKVCDFDASRCLDQSGFEVNQATTEEYRAPEVELREFCPANDVFSLGVVLFLLTGLPDFPVLGGDMLNSEHFSDHDLLTSLLTETLSERRYLVQVPPTDSSGEHGLELYAYTPDLIALICKMLQHDYLNRPTPQHCYDEFNVWKI